MNLLSIVAAVAAAALVFWLTKKALRAPVFPVVSGGVSGAPVEEDKTVGVVEKADLVVPTPVVEPTTPLTTGTVTQPVAAAPKATRKPAKRAASAKKTSTKKAPTKKTTKVTKRK